MGNAEITLKLGDKTKVLKVNVKAPDSVSLVVANDRTFYVAQNGTFDVSKVKVQIDYGDGFLSDEIALTDATAVFTLDNRLGGQEERRDRMHAQSQRRGYRGQSDRFRRRTACRGNLSR